MDSFPEMDCTEMVYEDWDDAYEMYGVFGHNSGFCYGQFTSEALARSHAEVLNEVRGYKKCDYCGWYYNNLQKLDSSNICTSCC